MKTWLLSFFLCTAIFTPIPVIIQHTHITLDPSSRQERQTAKAGGTAENDRNASTSTESLSAPLAAGFPGSGKHYLLFLSGIGLVALWKTKQRVES